MTFSSQTIHDDAERLLAQLSVPKRPKRIVCLTEETVEVLYRLGAGDLVAGVSIYVRRPPEARKKPRVSAFIKATSPRSRRCSPTWCSASPIFKPISPPNASAEASR